MAQLVYFSISGPTWSNGQVVAQTIGNTEQLAHLIEHRLHVAAQPIMPLAAYPNDYAQLKQRAEAENHTPPQFNQAPKVQSTVIYLGFPIWFNDVPPAVRQWVATIDSEVEIRPFVTHEGSGLGRAMQTLQASQLHIASGLAVRGSRVTDAGVAIDHWLLGFE